MILLDALYINNSGGRMLLNYLVQRLEASGKEVYYLLDNRVKGGFDYLPASRVEYMPASLWQRHLFYKRKATAFSSVLCFGNIPPTILLQVPVFTYFHNTVYFYTTAAFSVPHRLMLWLKARIIRMLSKNTTEWWVQTNEVQQLFNKYWQLSGNKVKLYPFFEEQLPAMDAAIKKPASFLYVSDGHPNKMHALLLQAFSMLSTRFPQASLYLTISRQYPALLARIDQMQQAGIKVYNLGWCTREMLAVAYQQHEFFIYPSVMESFGLGLIEAAQYHLKILAADLPYTNAVIVPSAVFNPNEVASMVACMQQALEEPLPPAVLHIQSCVQSMLVRLQ